ncbi:MAG: hypothetical protein ABSF71_19550 [Terriglobia bacterium]
MTKPNPWPCCAVLTVLFLCAPGLSPGIWAQQPEPASPPPTTQPKSPNDFGAPQSQPTPDPNVPRDDRILWTLPNYLTVENASSMPPMTALQKFNLIAKDTFDPVTFAFIGLEAGLNQASNTNPTFGQGLKGYAKRYGLAFTDNAVGNFMTSAVFPSMLHQDPRFYQMGRGGFFHRAWYAGTRVLITRSDSGRAQFNFSEILGNGIAAGMSNAYHPGPRTLRSNISIWETQMGWDAVSYEMKEFWPDVRRMFARHHP